MNNTIYLFLGAAFVVLICITIEAVKPHVRAHRCAVPSMSVTCGEVR